MKIAIDNRVIQHSGIGVYIRSLTTAMKNIDSSCRFVFFDDNIPFKRTSFRLKYINGMRRIVNEQTNLIQWMKNNNVDLFHNPRNTGFPLWGNIPGVVTVHDIIPHVLRKEYIRSWAEKCYYECSLRMAMSKSRHIITDSEFSKQEILKHYNVREEKISVIYIAAKSSFYKIHDESLLDRYRERFGIRRPFVLTIGGSEYRKNVISVARSFEKRLSEQYDLIVIGGAWRHMDIRPEFKNSKAIRFVSSISDEELNALYNLAEAFVFPSIYEGFGLPILEAMQCGTPVITANLTSLPEVAGEAVAYFNPYDLADIEEKMYSVLNSEGLKQECIERGFRQASLFSWEKCAKETLAIYKKCLGK